MTELYGDNYAFTDSTHGTNFGGPRHFLRFQDAAAEAAVSRLYGGIHYQFSNDEGFVLGNAVGMNINAVFASAEVTTVADANKPSIVAYPNPTSDLIRISGTTGGYTTMRIKDLMGRTVHSSIGNVADLTALPQGIYGLEVFMNGALVGQTKVVRQ